MRKHYAMVLVVEAEDTTAPEIVWECMAYGGLRKGAGTPNEAERLTTSCVYLGDPFDMPDHVEAGDFATLAIELYDGMGQEIKLEPPSALEVS